jgi:hypothetical protein
MKNTLLLLSILLFGSPLWSAVYEVGPGHLNSLGDVPWLNLNPGDSVKIHAREEPYREKIGIRSRGTEQNPIVIMGIPDGLGNNPHITGQDATTATHFNGFFSARWDEFLGPIVIKPGSGDPWGHKPGHIHIKNLKISGGSPLNTYTNTAGETVNYSNGAAAIWAVLVENFIVENCEITENGNGLFVLSKGSEEETSRNVVFRNNTFWENGNIGRDREHNIYTQVAGMVIENNTIRRLTHGAIGSSVKDRSSGTVIRHNYIESSARLLDLVEPEDSYVVLTSEPDFLETWVYGNVFINDCRLDPHSTNLIHFGGDTGVDQIMRRGVLHYYHNSLHNIADQSDAWYLRIFDVTPGGGQIQSANNIIWNDGNADFYLMNQGGDFHSLGGDWITENWVEGRSGFDGTISFQNAFFEGNQPGLDTLSFSPLLASVLIGNAIELPDSILQKYPDIHEAADGEADIGAKEFQSTPSYILNRRGATLKKFDRTYFNIIGQNRSKESGFYFRRTNFPNQ